MSDPLHSHQHCLNFCAVDVAKGHCLVRDALVMIDTPPCDEFEPAAACGHCRFFQPGLQGAQGTCTGLPDHGWTFPELPAGHCPAFQRSAAPQGATT